MPMEPMRRWNMEPWEAGPPPTRKRFTTPWKPLPFETPMHVDELALGESRDRDDVAGLDGERLGEADFVEHAGRRFEAGLLGVIGNSALEAFFAFWAPKPSWTAL
jgi:hypothetical protein